MPRPVRSRRVCSEPKYSMFAPVGYRDRPVIKLTTDEYEVMRLVDLEKLTHGECAEHMDISRTTVTEIYESAREKIADCIVNGNILVIEGGKYRICEGGPDGCGMCVRNAEDEEDNKNG